MARRKIRKKDTVLVTAGKSRGKRGKVLRVLPESDRVIVEGVNMVKRHQRPSATFRQGGIIEKEAPLHISNLMVIDPKTDKPTRVGMKILDDGQKVRVSKQSGEILDK